MQFYEIPPPEPSGIPFVYSELIPVFLHIPTFHARGQHPVEGLGETGLALFSFIELVAYFFAIAGIGTLAAFSQMRECTGVPGLRTTRRLGFLFGGWMYLYLVLCSFVTKYDATFYPDALLVLALICWFAAIFAGRDLREEAARKSGGDRRRGRNGKAG